MGSSTSERIARDAGLATAIESASEHLMAAAIVAIAGSGQSQQVCRRRGLRCIRGVGGHHVEVGKPSITRTRPADAALVSTRLDGESRGETVVFVSVDGVVLQP